MPNITRMEKAAFLIKIKIPNGNKKINVYVIDVHFSQTKLKQQPELKQLIEIIDTTSLIKLNKPIIQCPIE